MIPEGVGLKEISHPMTKFHVIEPCVTKEPFRKIMLKRTKRIRKYEKKLQQIQEEMPVMVDSKFLDTIDSTSEANEISFDTQCHNIYSDCYVPVNDDIEKSARLCVRGLSVFGRNHSIVGETLNSLTFDFDDIDEEDIAFKYKKLSEKQSFKKKYPPQQPKPLHNRKRLQQSTKTQYNQHKFEQTDLGVSNKKAGAQSPKLYNHSRMGDEKGVGQGSWKRITHAQLTNQSVQIQSGSFKANTLIDLNHHRSRESCDVPTSVRIPSSNTTEFKAIRKRALELLSQEVDVPKFTKAKSPATFSTQRLKK